VLQTIRALYDFLHRHNLSEKGVNVTIEFDDYDTAYRAQQNMRREFSLTAIVDAREPPPTPETKIMGIPVKFVAKV
jgi:hypothetical protein